MSSAKGRQINKLPVCCETTEEGINTATKGGTTNGKNRKRPQDAPINPPSTRRRTNINYPHKRRPKSQSPIKFYNRHEDYYEFTNFYMCKVHIDGYDWPSTEHYFQAQKFIETPYYNKIQMLRTPREAFQMSRQPDVSAWRRADWETVKDDVMYKALLLKFAQHENLRKKLIQTGSRELIEDSPHDSYWGIGKDGNGLNHLGKLLMQVRSCCKPQNGASTSASSDDVYGSHKSSSNTSPKNKELPVQPAASAVTEQTISDNSTSAPVEDSGVLSSGGVVTDEEANLSCCNLVRKSLKSVRQSEHETSQLPSNTIS